MAGRMVYEFKTHSLYYESKQIFVPNFSFTIDTLEIICELKSGKLLGVQGFFPLLKASIEIIELPNTKKCSYYIPGVHRLNCKKNSIYDLMKKVPETEKYFKPLFIRFDKNKGIIHIGVKLSKKEIGIKIDNNIICGCDMNLNIKSLYIIPNQFI